MKSDRPTRAILPKTVLREHGGVSDGRSVFDAGQMAFPLQTLFEQTLIDAGDPATKLDDISSAEDLLVWALDTLAHSPAGFALICRAAEYGWQLGISDLGTGGFHLDIPDRHLLVDHAGFAPESLVRSAHFRNAFLLTLIRGLRDVWQENRFGALERDYRPEAVLMLERVRAADSDTLAVLVAWELRGAGLPETWRHLLGSEEGDMALSFTNILERDPAAFMDGSALAQVFRQWFADMNRVDSTDHETLETLDMVMEWAEEENGGRNPFGSRALNGLLIEQLSCLPDRTAYLRGLGDDICMDPAFCALNDPINEAHLFHIVYDLEVIVVNHVPFRDLALARKIFPGGKTHKTS